MGRRGRRCKKLLDGIKEKRRYCKLKEEASALCGEFILEQSTVLSKDNRLENEQIVH